MVAKVQKPQAKPAAAPKPAAPVVPKIVEAVAMSSAVSVKGLTKKVEAAAVAAIQKASAEGITDPEEIRRRIREASKAAMKG